MSISTISFNKAATTQIMRIQTELRDVLQETGSGRHADVGLALGRTTGIAVSYRSQETSLDRQLDNNKLVTQRLTLAYDALDPVAKNAGALRDQLMTGIGADAFFNNAKQSASGHLDHLVGVLNLSVGGQYLFSGTQTDVRPVKPWNDGPAAALKTHFETFRSEAGSPLAAEDVRKFFNEGYTYTSTEGGVQVSRTIAFDDFFRKDEGAATGPWMDNVSQASDQPVTGRISKTETISTSVSANEKAFRDLMAGYAAIELASGDMDGPTRDIIANEARERLSAGLNGVTALRSELGNRQARVKGADEAIVQQRNIFKAHVSSLEDVDPADAATRFAALNTQLQASLRVNELIRQINILDYL